MVPFLIRSSGRSWCDDAHYKHQFHIWSSNGWLLLNSKVVFLDIVFRTSRATSTSARVGATIVFHSSVDRESTLFTSAQRCRTAYGFRTRSSPMKSQRNSIRQQHQTRSLESSSTARSWGLLGMRSSVALRWFKLVSFRLTVTSSCPMNLQYFPMDRQLCTIEIESCKNRKLSSKSLWFTPNFFRSEQTDTQWQTLCISGVSTARTGSAYRIPYSCLNSKSKESKTCKRLRSWAQVLRFKR